MNVLTRNPRCHVRIISLEYGEIPADLLRPVIRQVSTHRRLGNAAGSFQITLLPRRVNTYGLPNDWRDTLATMDYVEISIQVAPRPPVIVMRGFIDTVTEQGSIADGRPARTIQITGRDFGQLLLNTKLYYLDGPQQLEIIKRWQEGFLKLFAWTEGAFPAPEHPPLALNEVTDAPRYSPRDLLQNIFQSFYLPQEELILKQFPTVPPMRFFPVSDALGGTNEADLATIAPDVVTMNWQPWADVWMLLCTYQHSPWRELYVTDEAEGSRLVYRPTPWIDVNGNFVFASMETGHMGTMLTHQVSENDIVEYSLSHSQHEIRNFFFTYTDEFASLAQMAKTLGSIEGLIVDAPKGNPYLVGFQPSDRAIAKRGDYNIVGFRLQEVRTPFLDFDHRTSLKTLPSRMSEVQLQGHAENLKMVRALDHNGVLEFGVFHLRGDERIKFGHYLQLADATLLRLGVGARYYIEGVTQTFQQGSSQEDGVFVTTAEVSRGRGHMIRKGMVSQ